MRISIAALVALAGCSSPSAPSVQPPAPERSAAPISQAPIANHGAVDPPMPLEPLLVEPASGRSCALRWNEIGTPPIIELAPANGSLQDECAESFDPRDLTCDPGDDQCFEGTMRGGRRATLSVIGPEGSGRFETLGLAIDGKGFACMMGSTVGWRYLFPVGKKLAPLPWLADVDGDGDAELIVWSRLPWADDELSNALVPVVYALDGDRLVRRDDKAKSLRVKVADAYHELASLDESPDARPCFVAVTAALGG